MDAVMLACHAEPLPGNKILDIGTGCGIIPLILAARTPDLQITGIEIQESLAVIAEQNVKKNNFSSTISIVCKDVLKTTTAEIKGEFDKIISNPPFIKKNCGRMNPNHQKAVARHEITLNITGLVKAVSRFLRPGGTFDVIYPVERKKEVLFTMTANGIFPSAIRFIHTRKTENPKRVIISGMKTKSSGLKVLPPFFL